MPAFTSCLAPACLRLISSGPWLVSRCLEPHLCRPSTAPTLTISCSHKRHGYQPRPLMRTKGSPEIPPAVLAVTSASHLCPCTSPDTLHASFSPASNLQSLSSQTISKPARHFADVPSASSHNHEDSSCCSRTYVFGYLEPHEPHPCNLVRDSSCKVLFPWPSKEKPGRKGYKERKKNKDGVGKNLV